MYAKDGQTDGRTKATLISFFPTVGDIITTGVAFIWAIVNFMGGEVVHGEEKVNIRDTRRLQAPALLRCWARLAVARQVRNDRRRTT